MASHSNTVVAGAVFFLFGSRVIYKYGASDRQYQNLRANNLVMWEAIRWCCTNGFKRFSFGRTEPENKGLLQFKQGWGTREDRLDYYKYDLKKNSYIAEQQGIKSSYNFFKLMPLPLLKVTGNLLYRHVG
ncbi:MAG: peptidoglycan bridge formation glycyltransferase FemA/FemB family protein [Nitrospinales bacterium]